MGLVLGIQDAFSAKAAQISASAKTMDASVGAAAVGINRNLKAMMGGLAIAGAGAAMLMVQKKFVNATLEIDEGLAALSTLGVKNLKAIKDEAIAFSNQWAGSSAEEIIKSSYDIKSAISSLADEAIGPFAAVIALTGKATQASVQDMKEAFTTGWGIYRELFPMMADTSFLEAYSGALSKTVALFKTTGARMSEAISSLGATATKKGAPLIEQFAILGRLQQTMDPSRAGTAYMRFLQRAYSGSLKLGIDAVDPLTGKLKSMAGILTAIKEKFPELGLPDVQHKLEQAFGVRGVRAVQLLIGNIGQLEKDIIGVGDALNKGIDETMEMALKMNAHIGARFKLLGERLHNLARMIGDTIKNEWVGMADATGKVVVGFQKLMTANNFLAKGFMKTIAVLSTLGIAAGLTTAMFFGLKLVLLKTGVTAAGTVGKLMLLRLGIWKLWATLGPTILLMAAFYAGFRLLKWAWDVNFMGMKTSISVWYEKVKLVMTGVGEAMSNLSYENGRLKFGP